MVTECERRPESGGFIALRDSRSSDRYETVDEDSSVALTFFFFYKTVQATYGKQQST